MGFNPDDFFTITTVEDIVPKFPHLSALDYSKISLNEELIKVNYEVTSPEYKDFMASDIKEYCHFEVDTIV
ncbi:hypothetical protein [Sulfurimonas sp.]|uniref:hypothetical protein n=1 Tax=Sulfurimonas sp. TaxID=2022749 RepID=UPI003D0F7B5A